MLTEATLAALKSKKADGMLVAKLDRLRPYQSMALGSSD